jgi:hypothetical protein
MTLLTLLPTDLEDIIINYKENLEKEDHKKIFNNTLNYLIKINIKNERYTLTKLQLIKMSNNEMKIEKLEKKIKDMPKKINMNSKMMEIINNKNHPHHQQMMELMNDLNKINN